MPPPLFENYPGDIAIPNDKLIVPGQEPMFDVNHCKPKSNNDFNIMFDFNQPKNNKLIDDYNSPLLA